MRHYTCLIDTASVNRNPYTNIALEEAILLSVKKGILPSPLLRVWINPPIVVLGRFSNIAKDVNLQVAEEYGIPITRRISGGGTVFHDMGNLNISIYHKSQGFTSVSNIMNEGLSFLSSLLMNMGFSPTVKNGNDITVDGYKISGSASYSDKGGWLYHGTMLVSTDIDLMRRILVFPDDPSMGGRIDPVKYNPGNLSWLDSRITIEHVIEIIRSNCHNTIALASDDFSFARKLARCKYMNDRWIFNNISINCKSS
ncbi:MAG: lipoate--protein ligase family protein [Desulfurococcales archaeon]|nr:lipoate--protein ligase family protein [Desulfurococcales archaeon]